MPLDLTELRELLTALNQTDISELTLKSSDFELTVRRGSRVEIAPIAPVPVSTSTIAPPLEPTKPETPIAAPVNERKLADVVSPIVGTFYRSPSPDELPFADVGSRIQKGQVVCIIEAMKVMNEIEAEVSGEIVEVLVQNGEPVEYGQPLMRVNPA
ncbi:MAG: acetyl-CoA carboxylase biotin carboxyl carrier protein [Plectolyngbya sp. WJT66-NPBG17]|nr:acetyl-CoA carboxylase biotin carboxyl carrier protein [Plectolyngbya sp. WJT66-NPBG17]MBW4523979.1 acetyl-CoA carboxylase biotin carboxyl carrier protein [Phormidium tanganyikae FI6-MK23]